MHKNNTDFWKCWRSKFESSNECQQVECCVDPDAIVDKFYRHFIKSYTANNVCRAQELKAEYFVVRENYCGFPNTDNSYFDTEMVSKIIFDMKRGKAADIDGLTVEHLQYSHPIILVLLSKLFRLILVSRYIPTGFKRSYIVPIPKIKDCRTKAMSCGDFRGIAICPLLSKVYEHCLLRQLQTFIKSEDNQFGFKKGVGCSHAIYTARHIVDRWVSKGFTANLCAIDLTKAFDKVNHHAILLKLMRSNIPLQILEIIEKLLSDCISCVRWGNSWSGEFTIEFGVRQGSVLSPFLFAIYVDGLASLCRPERELYIILYADDILLLAPTVTALQALLHECEHELYLIDMAINFGKSSCVRIGARCDAVCATVASSCGQLIHWETELRYLGIYVVRSRTFKCSLTMAKRSFYRSANAVLAKICRRSSEEVILQLVRSKCLPALLYGLEACPLRSSDNSSLDFVVNRFFMKLFRTNNLEIVTYCRNQFEFDLPSAILTEKCKNFALKYSLCNNSFCKLVLNRN